MHILFCWRVIVNSLESKIKGFYDVLGVEIDNLNVLHNIFINEAKECGFQEVKTSMIELRERYLNTTLVHPSKIFEVHRVKEKSRYALQSDLAMSMSRFVADLPSKPILKLIQDGTMFRDRPANLPGFRKSFNQVLLGGWGTPSFWVDAEIISITWRGIEKIDGVKNQFIQISNKNIFDVIKSDLSREIRFSKKGIDLLKFENISQNDRRWLTTIFNRERVTIQEAKQIFELIEHPQVRYEFNKVVQLNNYLNFLIPNSKILFSLSNLSGTGHYSSLNYKVFISEEQSENIFDVADGGRIDDMTYRVNGSQVPGVCMGIGNTVLAQIMKKEKGEKKLTILVDDKYFENNYKIVCSTVKKFQNYKCNILPISGKKNGKILKSEFYDTSDFIIIDSNGNIQIRCNNEKEKLTIRKIIGGENGYSDKTI